MLSVISLGESDSRISIATPSDTTEPLSAAGRRILAFRAVLEVAHQDVLVVERPILPQRVAGEVVVQQDAAQVWMPNELDAEEIEDLTLLQLNKTDGGMLSDLQMRKMMISAAEIVTMAR